MIDTELESIPSSPLILVADDDPYTQQLLRMMLEREAFRVETAQDGQMAIEKAHRLQPDLILMDVQMPGVNGFEAVRRMRHDPDTTRIPIIIVSAAAREPTDVAHGLVLGADDYLVKPFSLLELTARVHSKIKARRLGEKLHRRTQELEALLSIGMELNQGLPLNDLTNRVLDATLKHFTASNAVLVLLENGQPTSIVCRGADISLAEVMQERTLPALLKSTGEAALVSELKSDDPIDHIFANGDCKSGIAAPIKNQGQLRGMLLLGDNEPKHFTQDDLRLLRSIAEQAALAIQNAQLYSQLQGYAQGLESMVKARTAELQSAQNQLMRAERLAALGTLSAGIAHEVNNPLQPILINLEMAIEDLDANQPVNREMLEFAKRDVERIRGIVSRLLDFARPAPPVSAPTDVNVVINEVLGLSRKQLEHNKIKFKLSLKAKQKIFGSADQLKQVFLNLIVNARDAMPSGGEIKFGTSDVDEFVVIKVRDTGTGIPQDKIAQIFDPFFTTKSEGTGLGLSVSYGIIKSHHGEIDVQSEPGKFTEFVIKLPIVGSIIADPKNDEESPDAK